MRISDWSSDVCSSDLSHPYPPFAEAIFLHIGLFHALEANAYAPMQKRRVMIGAARVDRETVGRNIGHLGLMDVRTKARGQKDDRSEERREGNECGGKGGYRWARETERKKKRAERVCAKKR